MDFLDEVEKAEEDVRSEVSKSRELIASGRFSTLFEEPSPEKDVSPLDSASLVASEISNAISAQKVELEERNKTVEMLQKAMKQQREFTQLHAQELGKEHKQQLSLQRQEYEGTIQRHLSFIDQLIDDKKVLSQRCEELVNKLKDTDQKYSSRIKNMEENQAVELKKQKEIAEAAEKLRREKWIQEKTKQIKEMTVKGLEPDIQKLIAKHKAEIKKLKAMHQGELMESDETAGRRYIQQMEEMREHLEREKDMAVQRERDVARQRYEKQLQQEEEAYQQQRRRLYAEIQEEKERLADQAQKIRHEALEEKEAFEGSQRQTIQTMQEEHRKALEEMERRHMTEINNSKEQVEIEKQQWIENYMKKQETYLLAKERELKEDVRDARDKEIEMVISRLEQETAQAREECERAAENRIKRIREKYENEMKELERSERSMRDRYNETKERMNDIENECIRLRSQLKQKDQENEDVRKLTDQLQQERGKVTDVVRQEFADRLVATEEDNKRLRNEMSEMKARHRLDIDRITQDKEEEMVEVHKRVKQAIAKKEETTQFLRQQMLAAEKRADHLEMLLTEQRKKILGPK